jgi:hypothetical protein
MKVLAGVFLSFAVASFAAAQSPKVEIFGGYSVEHIAPCGTTTTFAQGFSCGLESGELISSKGYFHGWNGAATAYFNRFVGITADVASHYGPFGSNSNVRYSFLFGPTFTLHTPVLNPFAHALFGVVKETAGLAGSDTSFSKPEFAIGGGIDLSLSRHLALRPIQLDYEWQKNPTSGLSNPTGFRLSAGIVLKF